MMKRNRYAKLAAFGIAAAVLSACLGFENPAATTAVIAGEVGEPASAPSAGPAVQVCSAAPSSSSEIPWQACVSETQEADPSFWDDAVFVGDSVTLKLKYYAAVRRKKDPSFLGKAKFLAAGSMGSGNALQPVSARSIHPLYNGKKAPLEDSAAKMGAKKIYIMLGINDIALYGIDRSAKNLEKLALRFLKVCPDAELFIQSATPMVREKQLKSLNNKNIAAYDKELLDICQKQKWNYLDVASVMQGSDGALKPEYCSDPGILGIHFTDKACNVWVRYILTHTGKETGG
jgi:hypothetical protein